MESGPGAGGSRSEPTAGEEFWEPLYAGRAAARTVRPNPALVDALSRSGAAPAGDGTALDLGCGEGGDAVWLATRGWTVTAVDVSPTALERVRRNAAAASVAERVCTARHDLAEDFPTGHFDLVAATYLHTPVAFPRTDVLRRAATATAPGGLLVVIEHASIAPWSWQQEARRFPAPEEVFDSLGLPGNAWTPLVVDAPQRVATGPDGTQTATVSDNVVVVRRRPE